MVVAIPLQSTRMHDVFGCEWITTDRDYARFPGLNWRSPFSRAWAKSWCSWSL
jgi:hypothetical protein